LAVSSTTLQWVEHLDTAFGEVKRVLKDKGALAFVTFGPKTLSELKRSFKIAVDKNAEYLHSYKNSRQIHSILKQKGFKDIKVSSRVITKLYPDFRTFFRALKGLGALNASPALPKGLRGRSKMMDLIKTYEANCRIGKSVYASFEVITGVCFKG
jgi:malonyl-CoA O-methyltransferase